MHRQQFMKKSQAALVQPQNQEGHRTAAYVQKNASSDRTFVDRSTGSKSQCACLRGSVNDDERYASPGSKNADKSDKFPKNADICSEQNEQEACDRFRDSVVCESFPYKVETISHGDQVEEHSDRSCDEEEKIDGSFCSENEDKSQYSHSGSYYSHGSGSGGYNDDDEYLNDHSHASGDEQESNSYRSDYSDVEENLSHARYDEDGYPLNASHVQNDVPASYVTDDQDQSFDSTGGSDYRSRSRGDHGDNQSYNDDDQYEHHSNDSNDHENCSSSSRHLEDDEAYCGDERRSNGSLNNEFHSSWSGRHEDDRSDNVDNQYADHSQGSYGNEGRSSWSSNHEKDDDEYERRSNESHDCENRSICSDNQQEKYSEHQSNGDEDEDGSFDDDDGYERHSVQSQGRENHSFSSDNHEEDNDDYHSNGSQDRNVHSSWSGNEDEDRYDDKSEFESQKHEDRSVCSGDQDEDNYEHYSNGSRDRDVRSYGSGDENEDRSYNLDDEQKSQDREDRSICSDDQDEDDYEHHSNGSRDRDVRSYGSGDENEDPSYNLDDEHESQDHEGHSICSDDHNEDNYEHHLNGSRDRDIDNDSEYNSTSSRNLDDRNSWSGDKDENQPYDVDDQYNHPSNDWNGEQEVDDGDYSSVSGRHSDTRSYDDDDPEEDRSYSGDNRIDDQAEENSYVSGDQVDDRSHNSLGKGDQLFDDGENSYNSDGQEDNPSSYSSGQEDRSLVTGSSEDGDQDENSLQNSYGYEVHSTQSFEFGDGSRDCEQRNVHRNHSSESMPVVELDEESDCDDQSHHDNQFTGSGHHLDENSCGMVDETGNDSSINDFDSFAYDASVVSMKHRTSRDMQIGDDVDCSDNVEDVSVLSSLPANTFATAEARSSRNERTKLTSAKSPNKTMNATEPSALYAAIGINNPLDEPSIASSVASVKSSSRTETEAQTKVVNTAKEQKSDNDSYSHSESESFAGDETLVSEQVIGNKSALISSPLRAEHVIKGSGSVSDDQTNPDNESLAKSEVVSLNEAAGSSLRLSKPKEYGGYSREQISRLISLEQSTETVRFKKRRDLRGQGKSDSLIEFASNVHSALSVADAAEHEQNHFESEVLLSSSRLLLAFEVLTGIFLQLSDELELLQTFANGKVSPAIEMLESILAFSKPLDDVFKTLQPILNHHLTAEIDEELDDFLYGMNLILDLLCELSHRVGEKQIWNARANNAFVTLLELLARDTLEVSCIYEDVDTPQYDPTDLIHDAWEATGHIEELKSLLVSDDLFMFRQICYEVILSTDQWCPNNNILMDICGIENMSNSEQNKPDEDDALSSPPEAALQVLEKIKGEPLLRVATMASILRRLLPSQAITDPTISESFARVRNSFGVPPSSLVTITSIPESWDDPDALGVAGVGKTTLAAMVANHDDIRRFYNDGIAWIYVGEIELNYNRYVQCLQDLLSQLEVEDDEEPLFPELLHIPGESAAMRKRREEGFMIYLRETIVEFLRFRNVLIILDDVCFEPDLDWFDFAPPPSEDDEDEEDEGSCAILITSRRRNLLPPADTVEVDMLDETEGIELLTMESGDVSKAIITDAIETKAVVRECACHALTIKSVGRWLSLKHMNAELLEDPEILKEDVIKSMSKILKGELQNGPDTMYEILNMSLSPTIDEVPTTIIKFCFAAFVRVFCDRKHISDFALADSTPIVPMASTELLFESLLNLEKEALFREGSLFHEQNKEAAKLIPHALASLGVFKVIITYTEAPEDCSQDDVEDEKYLQIMHRIQQEYGEYLYEDDATLTDITKDGEIRWNKAFSKAFLAKNVEWDTQAPDAGLDYALEMLPSHMMRGGLLGDAGKILRNEKFVRGRLSVLGRENGSRRHIKDCESLFEMLMSKRGKDHRKMDPRGILRTAYDVLGSLLKMGEDEFIEEEGSPEAVEVGRCHYEIGFSLAERRCWEGAILHWELSQEFLVSSLGMVELVAGLLFNIAVANTEMHEFDLALGSLKQCLRIRGAIHGEEHILYAQTIQKIGDVFLAMSDYQEAMESYDWALDVMHIEPSHHRINIGDTLEQLGKIHYSKGEIEESLQSYQDALRSKQIDLGEDHPELAQIYHHIGNCLSNLGQTDEAIAHLEEAIRLKRLDPCGGYELDSDVLTIEGILNNLNCKQKEGLECYEKALQILVTKVPHRKEKVAALLHLIGCVYLMSGEHKKASKLFEESLYARRRVLGFVHLDVASTLFNMAFLHQSRNRLDKALKCLEEALKIRQLRLPDSEKVAVTHEKIGNLARGIGKTKKAENAFTEALRIRKLIHGNSHEAVATVLQELGDLMDDLGEYEDAMKHYVEALEIRENRLGPDDLSVAETYYSMGFTLQNNGALDRALQCLEESLSIRKFQLGDDAKDVGDTLNMMGFLQAKRGEHDDALTLLWDALRIRKLQGDNVKVSETLNNIGNVHREKQEFDLSIECYEECLRIRRAELGDEHEKVADALIALGNAQSDMEYNEEAMDSYKEALAIRNMIFGEQDESVATVLQFMGTLEFRANELDRAFQLLDEFIRIRQDNGTEPDGDYVNVLFMIGNIHKMQGYEEDAKKCWTEAYGVFKSLGLAETNPQIAEVMSNLVKEDGVESTTTDHLAGLEKTAKNVLGRITANVKRVARTANEAGKAVKKVTGIKSKDRGSQLL